MPSALPLALLLLQPGDTDALPPVDEPTLPASANNAQGFVPSGWALEHQASGDLNRDGLPDLALGLKQQDPANVITNASGFCGETLDTNPRIIAVAFAQKGGGYRLAMQNQGFVPRHDNSCADDWFGSDAVVGGSLTVARGTLQLVFGHWMSAGSWSMGSTRYTFRWQQDDFRLIGFDSDTTHRGGGETSSTSVNFLTGRVRTATGSIETDKEKVRWSRLPASRLVTMEEIGDGMAFWPDGLNAE